MSDNNRISSAIVDDINRNPLGYESISKLLYKFSIPAIIGMTVNALYNTVDRIFIGNSSDLGAAGLGAITICFPIMIIILGIGILLAQGSSTLFAISLGEGKEEDANIILGNAVMMSVFFSILITIFGLIFIKPILQIFGASETLLPYAISYTRIILIGSAFQIIGMTLNNIIRADGKPKIAMATMFIGAIINIVLDPIFIYVLRMGMEGAAIATITSQFISAIWCLFIMTNEKERHRIRFKYMKINKRICYRTIILGTPGFMLQFVNSILVLILNSSLIKYGGDIAVSGIGIINSIQNLLLLPIVGLNQGLQPIVSFNYGAKKYGRMKKAVKLSITAAIIFTFIGFLISELMPETLIRLFNSDPELLEFTTYALRIWFMLLPIIGFQIVASNFFQAIGMPKKALILTMTKQVIILMPSIIILSRLFGINGILFSLPLSDLISSLVTSYFFFGFIRKIKTEE